MASRANMNHPKPIYPPPQPFEQPSYHDFTESPRFQVTSHFSQNPLHSQNPHETVNPKAHQKPNDAYEGSLDSSKGSSDKQSSATSVVIHIKLGEKLSKEICCDLDDNVLQLAQNFCKENNLLEQAVPVIIKMIKQQFAVVLQRMRNNKNNKGLENSVSFDERKTSFVPQNQATERIYTQESDSRTANMPNDTTMNKQNNGRPKLMGKLDVAIGPSQTRELRIYHGEDPGQAAEQFCDDNDLPVSLAEVLESKLQQILKQYEINRNKKLKQQGEMPRKELPAFNRITFGEKKFDENDDSNNEIDTKTTYNDAPREYRSQTSPKVQENNPNPFRIETNDHKDKTSTGSPNFPKQRTAVFAPEGRNLNKTETAPNIESRPKEVKEKEPLPQSLQNIQEDKDDPAKSYEKWTKLIKEKQTTPKQDHGKVLDAKAGNKDNFSRRERSPEPTLPENLYKEAVTMIGSKSPMRRKEEPKPRVVELPINPVKSSNKRMTKKEEGDLLKRLYYKEDTGSDSHENSRLGNLSRRQQEETRELTFQPNIDRMSPSPTAESRSRSPLRDNNQVNYKGHRERVLKAREQNTKAMQEKFSFRPKISDTSYELASNRERSRSPMNNNQKKEDSVQKGYGEKWKRPVYNNVHPFSPEIPEDINKFLKNRPQQSQKEFTNRLVKEATQRSEKRVRTQIAEKSRAVDEKTGQRLFSPVIKHDKYYEKVKKKEGRDSNSQSRSTTPKRAEYTVKSPQPDHQSVEKSKLQEVFDKLDSDKDGYISAHNIDLSSLSTNVLENLLEFMDFLEVNEAKIDFKGFILILRGLDKEKALLQVLENDKSADMNNLHGRNIDLFRANEPMEDYGDVHNTALFPTIEENDEESKYSRHRTPSKSTASSNQTENSARIPKHYQEILGKKLNTKFTGV